MSRLVRVGELSHSTLHAAFAADSNLRSPRAGTTHRNDDTQEYGIPYILAGIGPQGEFDGCSAHRLGQSHPANEFDVFFSHRGCCRWAALTESLSGYS